jgi:hypothetical protein
MGQYYYTERTGNCLLQLSGRLRREGRRARAVSLGKKLEFERAIGEKLLQEVTYETKAGVK